MDLHLNYSIPHEAGTVFAAWIAEESIVAPVVKIDINPVAGGVFRLTSKSPDGMAVMEGKILAIEKDKRIQYTWHWGGPASPSIVNVQFFAHEGETKVEIAHTGLDSEAAASAYRTGWDSYIAGLAALL